jgi:aspartate aminotransferase
VEEMMMGMMNERIAAISPSVTLAITGKAKALAAAGNKIFSFSAGEPDFDTPENIKAAAASALEAGETKYAPVAGLAELRKAISEKLAKENGLDYAPEQVLVSIGAKHSLFNAIMALCKEGDEVLIPGPYWLSYPEMVKIAGATPVFIDSTEERGNKVRASDIEEAITENTKAIILNSPSNPLGVVYEKAELEAIAEVLEKHELYVISDEIYEKLLYEGVEHVSIGSLSEGLLSRTITVNGFSKAFSMTGWRLGYFAGPLELVKAATALQSHSTSGATTFAQYGAIEAMKGDMSSVEEMLQAFAKRRDYLYSRLSAIDGVSCVKPMGAFYMLPNISSFGLDSLTFAQRLLDEEGVAVIPGAPFGADSNVRLSYACSMENIEGGMDLFEKFVKSL